MIEPLGAILVGRPPMIGSVRSMMWLWPLTTRSTREPVEQRNPLLPDAAFGGVHGTGRIGAVVEEGHDEIDVGLGPQ